MSGAVCHGVTQRSIPLNGITAFLSQLRLVSVEGSKQSAARHPSRHIAEEARECGAILEMSSISSSSALMRPNLIFGYFVNFALFRGGGGGEPDIIITLVLFVIFNIF